MGCLCAWVCSFWIGTPPVCFADHLPSMGGKGSEEYPRCEANRWCGSCLQGRMVRSMHQLYSRERWAANGGKKKSAPRKGEQIVW